MKEAYLNPAQLSLSITTKLQGTVNTNVLGSNNSLWLHIMKFMSIYTRTMYVQNHQVITTNNVA